MVDTRGWKRCQCFSACRELLSNNPYIIVHFPPSSSQVATTCYDKTSLSVIEDTTEVTATAHTLSSLPPLTLCCITVFQKGTCVGADVNGLPAQTCGMTLDAPPLCATNLTVTATSYSSLLVQWNSPPNAVPGLNYTIQVMANSMLVNTLYSLTNTFAFVSDLEPNTNYTVHLNVESTGGSGSGSASGSGAGGCTVAEGSTPMGTPPAPTNVSLDTMDCTLIGSWWDASKTSYNVVNYGVYARCNDILVNASVPSDAMSVNLNICDTSNSVPLGGALSWCTLQVQSCDSISCGQFSELALTVIPSNTPAKPLCFITEEVGTRVFISFTLSAPFALDDLTVDYSLVTTSDMQQVNKSTIPFDGSNTLSFSGLFRNLEYQFSLKLCDNVVNCGDSCTLNFTPNTVSVHYQTYLPGGKCVL